MCYLCFCHRHRCHLPYSNIFINLILKLLKTKWNGNKFWITEDYLLEEFTFLSSRDWQRYLADYLSIFPCWFSVQYLLWAWQIPGISAGLVTSIHGVLNIEEGLVFSPTTTNSWWKLHNCLISHNTFVVFYSAGVESCFLLSNQSLKPQNSPPEWTPSTLLHFE